MGNFDTPNLHRLSQLGKSYMYKKTTVNLFQTSDISKFYIKKTYRSAGSIEIKACPIKAMSRSEFKFLSISFLGHPGCLIHLVLYWLWKALQGFQKNKQVFMKKVSSQFSISNFFTCFEECRVQFAGYGA